MNQVIRVNGDPHDPPHPDPAPEAGATAIPPSGLAAAVAAQRGEAAAAVTGRDPSAPTPSDNGKPASTRSGTRRQALLVNSAIWLVGVMVVIMLSIIYIRWLTVTEPTAAIVVYGDETLDGTRLVVRGEDGQEVLDRGGPITLNPSNDFVTPVLLMPGSYHLVAKRGEAVLKEVKFYVGPYQGQAFYLSEAARRRSAEAGTKPHARGDAPSASVGAAVVPAGARSNESRR